MSGNLSQLSITRKCQLQLEEFFSNFTLNQYSWALQSKYRRGKFCFYQFVRSGYATSKIPSGLWSLNFGEIEDFQQCINIAASSSTGEIFGKYCLGYLVAKNTSSAVHREVPSLHHCDCYLTRILPAEPLWALCLPDGCTTNDASRVGDFLLTNLVGNEVGVRISDLFCQTVKEVNPPLTNGAIVTIVILALLLSTVVLSTVYDMFCIFHGHKSCPMLVKCFSAYTNSMKLFKMTTPTPDQLPCLNGLKCLSMVWVVYGHTFAAQMVWPITNTKYYIEWLNNWYSTFLVSATLSVDTFFTIGSALMSYGFMKAKCKHVPFKIFLYYLHRYLRLTAPFAIVVLVSATLLKYMGSGPLWPIVDQDVQQPCAKYWWSALLYVQNYVNLTDMCLGHSWYLSVDFQLYLISPVLLYALWNYPRICLSFLLLCILGFIGVSFHVACVHNLSPILTNLYGNVDNYENFYYYLTHTRGAPWFIGIILGYCIFKLKENELILKLNKFVIWIIWGVCFATMLACSLGGYNTLVGEEYDRWGSAFHIALVRPVWSLAISWIILACTNNYGGPINWVLSLPIFQVLNRFTYSIYLVHVTILYVITYDKKQPDYFSNFNMAYDFWGILWFSAGVSYLLVLMTESPIVVIEKMLFGISSKRKQSKRNLENGVDNSSLEQ
ncbi:nose resistant to fluoxetine protein 6-like [Tenebrio molitor]|uniref:nose resistant to fluoxetine protein 6-like n=1 Tax=Tenebrio molitor TaxID=7067 RepID=UPI003624887B